MTYKPTYFRAPPPPPPPPRSQRIAQLRRVRRKRGNPVFSCCDCAQIPSLRRKHQCRRSLSRRLLLPWRPRSSVGFEGNLE